MSKAQGNSESLEAHENAATAGRSVTGEATTASPSRLARIRELNDHLRTSGRGGIVMITNGLAALGQPTVTAVFAAITRFTAFDADNDPWGEHDCAVLTVGEHRVIWKIDYYDRSRTIHSPDPADPKFTVRVLTVMLANEY